MLRLFLIGLIIITCVFLVFHAIKSLVFVIIFGILIALLWHMVAPRSGVRRLRF